MSKDIHVIPFNQLPATDRVTIAQQANWRVDGNGDWNQVVDKRYGSVHHVAIVDADGVVKFDKISIAWSPGVFVVPYRYNESEGKGHHEFLVPTERRILLYDANGQQGNVFVDNIPQGLINVDKEETPEEAAVRETKEETGFVPTQLIFLGNIGFDIANSSSLMPFFLAHVPFAQEAAKLAPFDAVLDRIYQGLGAVGSAFRSFGGGKSPPPSLVLCLCMVCLVTWIGFSYGASW